MATISIHMPELSGDAGFTLYLRAVSDGTLTNTGGDALTESPASSGRFTCTVAESLTELHHAQVQDGTGGVVRDGWVEASGTLVKDSLPDVLGPTVAELSAVPAATATLSDKITWLYMWARNKVTQTASTTTLLADDGTTAVATSTTSDDGTTFTGTELS